MDIIKFAIWGIGVRGKVLLRMMKGKVACIIEENSAYHNTYYENIPIVSLEKYISLYSECPVIITPMNYEDEIAHDLADKGNIEAIYYSSNTALIEAFWAGTPIENSLKKYDRDKKIIVYGGGLLGYLLYDYLQDNNFKCSIAMQHDYQGNISLQNGQTEWTRESVKEAQIILTIPLTEKDKLQVEEADIKYEEYYETIMSKDLYFNPQLECFKNIHCGRRCFVVATGPSLRMEDLDKLYENRELCFSVNGIFPAFDKTKWRPDYYMVSDPEAVVKWKSTIIEADIEKKFIASRAWMFDRKEVKENMYRWHVFRILNEGIMPQFSEDFARGTYTGMTIIYDGVLQLAVYMGFSEIYLLGVDCNYKKGGKNNYFFNEQKEDVLNHHEEEMMLAYQAAKEYADAHGIKIYNATRGGMLEIFERVDFDSLFESKEG